MWIGSTHKYLTCLILLWCYVFQHLIADTGPGVDFFMKSLQTDALAALRRMCVVEMIASETPER